VVVEGCGHELFGHIGIEQGERVPWVFVIETVHLRRQHGFGELTMVCGVLLTRIAVFVLGSQNGVLPGLSVAHFNRSCPPVEVRLEILVAGRLLLGGQGVVSAFLAKIGANLGGFRLVF
jgi:hypothetical protein